MTSLAKNQSLRTVSQALYDYTEEEPVFRDEEVLPDPFLLEVGKTYRATYEGREITFPIRLYQIISFAETRYGNEVGSVTQFTVLEVKPRNEYNTYIRVRGIDENGKKIEGWTVWFHHHHEIEVPGTP